jgi:glyoxylase I family protein
MSIRGIEHVAIAAREPKKLAQWYIERLNFSFSTEIGPTVYIHDSKGTILEFVPSETTPAPPKMRDLGLRHIAFEVDDLDQATSDLAAAGVELTGEPITLEGMRLQFFRDPEGNFLHLVKRERPLPR